MTRLDKMRALCGERNISIAKLERMADIGNGCIDNWDFHEPRLSTLDKVSRALGMPLVELIDILCASGAYCGHENRRGRTKKFSV